MVTLLGLGSALFYGAADFLGGAASRRATVLPVLMVSVPVGLAILCLIAIVAGDAPAPAGLAWGFGSGLAGGAGLITFYRALASGPMSVVAPVSALAAAVLPVVVGTLGGERLAPPVLVGVLLCLAAIALVSMEENGPGTRPAGRPVRRFADSGPLMAALSGTGFGVFFVLLRQGGDESGFWPLVASRSGGLAVILAAVLVLRLRGGPRSGGTAVAGTTLVLAVLSGLLDGIANLLYFLAAQAGMLSMAAVLTSLYPAVTVLLARVVYSERLRVIQRLGLAVAVAGVALVTIN
ncbi:EamA family transporter [Actinomadura scrupuli]|uniref:EamA family transporter n=1 Tax=Actinomadura scrupuli TaxID=559629 RepID=UPI003D96F7C8